MPTALRFMRVMPMVAGTAKISDPRTARPAIFSEFQAAICSVAERTGSSSAAYHLSEKPCGGYFNVCPEVNDIVSAITMGATR